ncbi:hypothetical protein VTN31DRAFT_7269 [Thermomyces dupontii]|uniref:uncharacterized protein n=1 Tax=Talaromyces thermophilus TaxID=28565 RepID=UPI0037449651
MAAKKAGSRAAPLTADIKPANKIKRQLLHIKRKRIADAERRQKRIARKREEAKNPALKEERLHKNIPLTLERKRVWDDLGSDTENILGLSVDVERIQHREQEDKEASESSDHGEQRMSDAPDVSDNDDEQDEVDSMIITDSESDDEGEETKDQQRTRKKNQLPTPSERATSPTPSTTSTNLNIIPEALAAKFPTLVTNDFPTPKILVTTAIHSTLHREAELLTDLFPNSTYIRRTAHRYSYKFSIREICKFASNRNYTAVIVMHEDQKRPSGLTIVHLPSGPTFHFSMTNWVEGKKLPGHGRPTNHWPELILQGFRTPLGLLTAHLFRTLLPPQPDLEGRQVVTILNQRDYIFVRRHRYVFREKRETEKPAVGPDGKEIKGVEGIKAGLQELGPRFTLKLRRIDKGIQRASGQEWEWKGGMEKTRTKFQL